MTAIVSYLKSVDWQAVGLALAILTSLIGVVTAIIKVTNHFTRHQIDRVIRYGQTIRLKHKLAKGYLQSDNRRYSHNHSSNQFQISAAFDKSENNLWVVRPKLGVEESKFEGRPIRYGQIIRLENKVTSHLLHSHIGAISPMTFQQEVTGYPAAHSDNNDHWVIEHVTPLIYKCLPDWRRWKLDKHIRLVHHESNMALHSHIAQLPGQQAHEVTGFPARDENDLWLAVEKFKHD